MPDPTDDEMCAPDSQGKRGAVVDEMDRLLTQERWKTLQEMDCSETVCDLILTELQGLRRDNAALREELTLARRLMATDIDDNTELQLERDALRARVEALEDELRSERASSSELFEAIVPILRNRGRQQRKGAIRTLRCVAEAYQAERRALDDAGEEPK